MFKHAFTFGKFLPFHRGHEAMILFALSCCEQLSIIVCASDQETIPAQQRCQWITETFAPSEQQRLKLIPFHYVEHDLPNTSESSFDISALWVQAFKPHVQSCDAVITSEPYGDYVAQLLGIQHQPFDMSRQHHPISASTINANP
ncbi:MAG: hypothetical protein ACRCWR_12700 [Saezia sp.]